MYCAGWNCIGQAVMAAQRLLDSEIHGTRSISFTRRFFDNRGENDAEDEFDRKSLQRVTTLVRVGTGWQQTSRPH